MAWVLLTYWELAYAPASTAGAVSIPVWTMRMLGSAGAVAKPGSVLPTFFPLQGGPKPDYASTAQQYEDGWDLYPSPPIKAWTKGPPGMGSTINVISNSYNPPSTPLDQNPAWQEVN